MVEQTETGNRTFPPPLHAPLKVVCWNIMTGGTGRADPLAEVILAQHPDIVVLLEATDPEVTERLAWRLRMDFITGVGLNGDAVAVLAPQITWSKNIALPDTKTPTLEVGIPRTITPHVHAELLRLLAVNGTLPETDADIIVGSFAPCGRLTDGYTAAPLGPTYSTQSPTEQREFILARNATFTSAKVETDRLAQFASDHFPIVAEITP